MFRNRATIKVKGLNQERAINNLSKTLKIYNYKREEQNLSQFEVELKHTKKIKQMLEQEGLEVLSISHKGFYSKIKQSFLRYGILAGIVIIILFSFKMLQALISLEEFKYNLYGYDFMKDNICWVLYDSFLFIDADDKFFVMV